MVLVLALMATIVTAGAQGDYYLKKAQQYQRQAEYYQKKADGHRREATYRLKKAEGYQRDAAYYTKRGDLDRARTYTPTPSRRWTNMRRNCAMPQKRTTKPPCICAGRQRLYESITKNNRANKLKITTLWRK